MKTPIDFSGLVDLFNPKVEAEGAAMQARTRNFDAEARYNDARAGQLGDRRKALSTEALAAAGYSPRQIAALQATQTDRMSDLFGGVQTDEGTQMLLKGGDPRVGMTLLGQGAAASKPDFAFTDGRADQISTNDAAAKMKQADAIQRLQNAGSLAVAQARPVELSAGASALFAPGDPRNPNGVAQPLVYQGGQGMPMYRPGFTTTPSQVFTAPAAPGSVSSASSGTGRVGNPTLDEAELLKKIQLEEAGGKALASQAQYPIAGGAAFSDAVTNAARAAYPTDTPSVAISKWMQANGVSVENDWNAFSSNQSILKKGDKPLSIADLLSPGAAAAAAPTAGAAPAAAAPGAAPAAAPSAPAPAAPAAGPTPTKSGGVSIDGIPFEPSSTLRAERKHGDQYTGINAKTNQLETRYWDEVKGTWSKAPVFTGNGDAADVRRVKGEDTYLGIIPKDSNGSGSPAMAAARLIDQGLAAGIIDPQALAAAQAADAKAAKTSYRGGGNVNAYLASLGDKFNALDRANVMKDPRVSKFAAGDFSGDAGLPDEAMALAEQMGINRAQFGIPEAGIGESLPLGLGAVIAPAGYGAANETMARGLTEFFKAVRDGRVNPQTLAVRPPSAPQPVAAR